MKKRWKACVSVLLVFCVLCSVATYAIQSAAAAVNELIESVGDDSGQTGEVYWRLNGTTLTIYGEGKMEDDYGDLKWNTAPWRPYWKTITKVVVEEGVTAVGMRAFHGCENLTSISIADSVEYLGGYAFENTKWERDLDAVNGVPMYAGNHFYMCNSVSPADGELVVKDGTVSISTWAFTGGKNIKRVVLPDSMGVIGSYAFAWLDKLTEIEIQDGLYRIEEGAFKKCASLREIFIPASVKTFGSKVFEGTAADFIIYGFTGTEAERYAKANNIRFEPVTDEFIRTHLAFVEGTDGKSLYRCGMDDIDVSDTFIAENSDMNRKFNLWSNLRGNWFDNPYDLAVADMVVSSGYYKSREEAFVRKIDLEWMDLGGDLMDFISVAEPNISQNYLMKIKQFFDKKGQKVLPDKAVELLRQHAGPFFDRAAKAAKISGISIDFYNLGVDIVGSCREYANCIAMYKAYQAADEDFKAVMESLYASASATNPKLAKAIAPYIKSDDPGEHYLNVVEKLNALADQNLLRTGMVVYDDFFSELLIKKVTEFVWENASDAAKASVKFSSFLAGARIGYQFGVAYSNIFFNTDQIADAYLDAYATARIAQCLKQTVESCAGELKANRDWNSAHRFCHAFTAFREIQLNTVDRVVTFLEQNNTSCATSFLRALGLLKEKDTFYARLTNIWMTRRLNWEYLSCHGFSKMLDKVKHLTVACPVDVTISDSTGEIVKIVNEQVQHYRGGFALVRNGIKYITLPDGDYQLTVTARSSGVMSCAQEQEDVLTEGSSKTERADGVILTAGAVYTAALQAGSEEISLTSNGRTVGTVSSYTADSEVAVSTVTLSRTQLTLDAGKTAALIAGTAPRNASNKALTWYSENSAVAVVDEYGNITAKSAGETDIVCEALGGGVEAKCHVTVTGGVRKGDINGDGVVSIDDITLLQRYLAEFVITGTLHLSAADADGDNSVTVSDATYLQRYLAEYTVDLDG